MSGVVDEAMMFGPGLRLKTTYETVPDSNRLTIRDEVQNVSGRPMEMELLYHTNFGKPFLEAGSQLVSADPRGGSTRSAGRRRHQDVAKVFRPDA